MSRIEEAIEKASRLRSEDGAAEKAATKTVGLFNTERQDVEIRADNPYLVTLNQPESPVSEEYRKLKSMVVKLTRKDGFNNTIMVTSTVGGEGKSITALNLAITLSQEYDYTVLLVDADLRQPSIHEYLGIRPKIGLSDCLLKGNDIGSALIRTGIGKMVLLPSGEKVENPVELLASKKMRDLIKEMKHRYVDRFIIFDVPPILPFAEVHSIASVLDGVIFVIKEDHAPLSNIKEALNLLKESNLLGVVYNGAEINQLDSNYYYYYRYRSYYKKQEAK